MKLTPKRTAQFCLLFLLLGSAMRLVWPGDMEWKLDEQWNFETAQLAASGGAFPLVGSLNSQGHLNPGAGLWLFILFSKFAKSPIALVRWIQILNIAALWGYFFLFRHRYREEESIPFYLGLAAAAVSPMPIIYSRKIWIQCLLPPFSLLLFFGHLHRERFWGAFLFGFAGLLLGQIHMSGFFFLAALGLFSLLTPKKLGNLKGLFLGAAIASVGLIPWLLVGAASQAQGLLTTHWLKEVRHLRIFTYWLSQMTGIGVSYSLGTLFFKEFIRGPFVGEYPTFLNFILLVASLFLGLYALSRGFSRRNSLKLDSEFSFYFLTALAGYGIIFTLTGVVAYPHYLVIVFPWIEMGAVWALLNRPKLCFTYVVLLCLTSLSFLAYIHMRGGAPGAEYGVAYQVSTSSR